MTAKLAQHKAWKKPRKEGYCLNGFIIQTSPCPQNHRLEALSRIFRGRSLEIEKKINSCY